MSSRTSLVVGGDRRPRALMLSDELKNALLKFTGTREQKRKGKYEEIAKS